MSELPKGWSTASFGELADIKLGKMLDKAKNRGEPTSYLRNVNVRWGAFDLEDIFQMPMLARERAELSIRDGDILVCEGGEPGRAAVWNRGMTDLAFQKALMRVRPREKVAPRYIASFLFHASQSGDLEQYFTGTTIKHLPQAALAGVMLPLPPAAEQRRIVAKIDSLTAKSAHARDNLDHIPRLVEKYKQAVLAAAFRDLSVGRVAASEVSVADVAATVFDGPFGSNLKTADYTARGARVVRLENLGHLRFDAAKETYISDEKYETLKRHTLFEDDILFSSFIDKEIRVCRFPRDISVTAINKADCFCIRVDRRACLPRFLELRLACRSTYDALEQTVHGATRPRISLSQLREFRFNLPTLDEQEKIVRRIESAFAWIDRLAKEASSARKLVDHLDQAVLAKAFRGELVPQDPNDEPADVLLERIRAERAQAAAPQSSRRGRKTKSAESAS